MRGREEDTGLNEEIELSGSVSASGRVWGVNINADLSLSSSKETKASGELKTEGSYKEITTSSSCITYKAQLRNISFSREFVRDLGYAIRPDPTDKSDNWVALVKKYGTNYYKSATVGGKLTMVTKIQKVHFFSKSKNDTMSQVQGSFSAGASGWGISGSASASYAGDTSGESYSIHQVVIEI